MIEDFFILGEEVNAGTACQQTLNARKRWKGSAAWIEGGLKYSGS